MQTLEEGRVLHRYVRNLGSPLPERTGTSLHEPCFVAGCGGLEGFVITLLARLGVGELRLVDGDAFEASSLNRQLLRTPRASMLLT